MRHAMGWLIAAAWSVAAVPPAAADRAPHAHTIEVGRLTRTHPKPWRGILARIHSRRMRDQ